MSSSWSSAPSARIILGLGLVFLLTLPGVTRRIYAADEVEYYSFLRSMWFDHDLSFENEYRHFYDAGIQHDAGFHETFLERSTETGRRLNFGTAGCALLWAPFYAVADAGTRVARALGVPVEADGYSAPYVSAVCLASACYGFLALLLSWYAARRVLAHVPGARSVAGPGLAAWAVFAGTPLLFYIYIAPPMAHATSAFAVSAFILAWLAVRDEWSPKGLAVLGIAAAIMAMVREQDAFFIVGPAVDFIWSLATERRVRLLGSALVGLAAFAIGFLPQALAYVALNGRIGPSGLVSRKMTWTAPHGLQVLLSPEHGFLFWTPLAVLAFAGLGMLVVRTWPSGPSRADGPRTATPLALGLVAVVLAQLYVAGSVESWTVAGAFGQRRFVALTPVLIIGIAVLWAGVRSRPARAALVLAGGLCVWWNLGLMVQFGTGMMDRQRLEPARNAYNTFVTVPRRLPEIAYRYVFERERFYRATPPAGRQP